MRKYEAILYFGVVLLDLCQVQFCVVGCKAEAAGSNVGPSAGAKPDWSQSAICMEQYVNKELHSFLTSNQIDFHSFMSENDLRAQLNTCTVQSAGSQSDCKQQSRSASKLPNFLPKGVSKFLAEAWSIRKSLVHPSFREVFKLTIIAVIFIGIAMVAITGLDSFLNKVIAEPIIRRWMETRTSLNAP